MNPHLLLLHPTLRSAFCRVAEDFERDAHQAELFGQVFLLGFKTETDLPTTDLWDEILGFEPTREELQDYF